VSEPDSNRELLTAATSLTLVVDGLRVSVDALVKRAEKSERRIFGIVLAVILDISLTIGLLFLWHSQTQTTAALDDTKSQVLCPLYASFLGSYNPTSRAPGQDRETYENVFSQMRAGYAHLSCDTPLVPKPTSVTPQPPPTH
jgi:hypothetical protein